MRQASRKPAFHLGAGKAIGHAVIIGFDLNMIIGANAAHPPFSAYIGYNRQRQQFRPVELFRQLPARQPQPADRPFLVQPLEKTTDRGIDFGKAVKGVMAQTPEQPALDEQYRLLNFCLIPRASWPGWKAGCAVMGRHIGVSAVDLWIIEAGLDHRDLGVIGNQQMRDSRVSIAAVLPRAPSVLSTVSQACTWPPLYRTNN